MRGVGCMFAGLCYSEFAAMVPVCGSAYAYSYATLGEIVAWFVGWNLVLEYMMACSTVAVGWSRYFVAFLDIFHVHLPDALTSAPLAGGDVNTAALVGHVKVMFPMEFVLVTPMFGAQAKGASRIVSWTGKS